MISHTLRDQLLIDELQLGQSLNQAVHEGRRGDFALLLAMLSPDVEDQPWVADALPSATQTIDWRRRFELPRARPLQADAMSAERAVAITATVQQGDLTTARLLDCLDPEPLLRQQYALDPLVWENMSPLIQQKYQLAREGTSVAHDPLAQLPPAAMLDSISAAVAQPDLTVRYFTAA